MKLAAYLEANGINRRDFAARIGVSGGRVTQLCEDGGWPSREVAERITVETAGAVTADDFLRIEDSEVAADEARA